jgi:hypothetical protein
LLDEEATAQSKARFEGHRRKTAVQSEGEACCHEVVVRANGRVLVWGCVLGSKKQKKDVADARLLDDFLAHRVSATATCKAGTK